MITTAGALVHVLKVSFCFKEDRFEGDAVAGEGFVLDVKGVGEVGEEVFAVSVGEAGTDFEW